MPIATLSLKWVQSDIHYNIGWRITICGSKILSDIDLSSLGFKKTATSPYTRQGLNPPVGTGPIGWVLSPIENPTLSSCDNQEPPFGFVTGYLNVLEEHGYKIVGTHALNAGTQIVTPILSWTLQTQ